MSASSKTVTKYLPTAFVCHKVASKKCHFFVDTKFVPIFRALRPLTDHLSKVKDTKSLNLVAGF